MMKKALALLLVGLLLLGLCSCQTAQKDLKFYVVRGEDADAGMVDSTLLQIARKKGRIAFTGEDIRSWYWADHQVLLRDLSIKGSAADGGSALFRAEANDLFLLVLGNDVLMVGGFAPAGDSPDLPREIYIEDGAADNFAIGCRKEYSAEADPRNVEKLYHFLAEQDLLAGERSEQE